MRMYRVAWFVELFLNKCMQRGVTLFVPNPSSTCYFLETRVVKIV